jgi:uncharacterized protein YndB with AHSA1/START domain
VTEIRLVRDYPHPVAKVWRALTDPELLALWSMRPEGFSLEIGARFKFFGEANRHWRGFVECEILEVEPLSRLVYSWVGDEGGKKQIVSYDLEARGQSTRLTVVHRGFEGISGFLLAKLVMGPGWKKMLDGEFRTVLDHTDPSGALPANSKLKPKY